MTNPNNQLNKPNKPRREDWEIEFDKQFVTYSSVRNVEPWFKDKFGSVGPVKSFIRNLLSKTKSQIVEQILEVKPKKSKMGYACGNCGDFLDDEVSNYCSTCGYKVKWN